MGLEGWEESAGDRSGASKARKRALVRTAGQCEEENKPSAVESRMVSEASLVTGATMKRCPCRTARPSGPSTRRGPRVTEPPCLLPGLPCTCLNADLSYKQRFPDPYLFTYF